MPGHVDEERASYIFQRQVLGTLAVLFPALLAGVSVRTGLGIHPLISDHAADPIVGTRPFPQHELPLTTTTPLLLSALLVLAGCSSDPPVPADAD